MPSYRVTWEIEVDADNPLDAAMQAHNVQLSPDRIVDFYEVVDAKGLRYGVDLVDWSIDILPRNRKGE